jgi:hypothetical protein
MAGLIATARRRRLSSGTRRQIASGSRCKHEVGDLEGDQCLMRAVVSGRIREDLGSVGR